MATATSSHPALVLADPPAAGRRVRTRSNEEATVDAELLAAPEYGRELATLERAITLDEPGSDYDDDESEQT